MSRKFQRRVEDFICENCGLTVEGDGFTNHCHQCLWSKHVDVNPGDRAETCQGMMPAIEVEVKSGKYRILHRCKKCGAEHWNKAVEHDDFEVLLQIISNQQKLK
ncbi:MAG: RNHCP domain-containing protein [Chloroflexota bacterium]